jgi:hypothetical protein
MKGVILRDKETGRYVADVEPPRDGTVRQTYVEESSKKGGKK